MPVSRRQLLRFALAATVGFGLTGVGTALPRTPLVKPPRALPGEDFFARCLRCGACVQACPTHALSQRDLGLDFCSVGAPYISARKGGCTAWQDGCRRCAEVCPSGALNPDLPLAGQKLGIARFKPAECTNCMVCLRRCPVPKAVYFPNPDSGEPWCKEREMEIPTKLKTVSSSIKPVIDEHLCVGCGICVAHCIPKIMRLDPL